MVSNTGLGATSSLVVSTNQPGIIISSRAIITSLPEIPVAGIRVEVGVGTTSPDKEVEDLARLQVVTISANLESDSGHPVKLPPALPELVEDMTKVEIVDLPTNHLAGRLILEVQAIRATTRLSSPQTTGPDNTSRPTVRTIRSPAMGEVIKDRVTERDRDRAMGITPEKDSERVKTRVMEVTRGKVMMTIRSRTTVIIKNQEAMEIVRDKDLAIYSDRTTAITRSRVTGRPQVRAMVTSRELAMETPRNLDMGTVPDRATGTRRVKITETRPGRATEIPRDKATVKVKDRTTETTTAKATGTAKGRGTIRVGRRIRRRIRGLGRTGNSQHTSLTALLQPLPLPLNMVVRSLDSNCFILFIIFYHCKPPSFLFVASLLEFFDI